MWTATDSPSDADNVPTNDFEIFEIVDDRFTMALVLIQVLTCSAVIFMDAVGIKTRFQLKNGVFRSILLWSTRRDGYWSACLDGCGLARLDGCGSGSPWVNNALPIRKCPGMSAGHPRLPMKRENAARSDWVDRSLAASRCTAFVANHANMQMKKMLEDYAFAPKLDLAQVFGRHEVPLLAVCLI
ncbi:hypothetical protein FF38_07416 [Lucilia cuprina]|uniref:Uncharacterized protein n=1 Tax=Lucilia cuprina TaxID=7375 RepID=A0A0L0BWP1_LUCCU|nr:hypothetical protein FF38_07416 [Lucilia cuprina]